MESSRPALEQTTLVVLRQNVAENGSALPPFRLPQVARQIVAAMAKILGGEDPGTAPAFGEQLGAQGLGLRSWLAVGRALTNAFVSRACGPEASGELKDVALVLSRLYEFVTGVVDGLARHDRAAMSRERDEIQKALERVIESREDDLRRLVEQLSTPVMPVYGRILVLPLIGAVNDERARRITERLLDETARRQARIVIIDATGLATSDTGAISSLVGTMRAVQLLGARAVLVGIQPEIVRTLTELDADLAGLLTLANLQSGIEWALRELGLAILPRASPALATSHQPNRRSRHHGD